jgi:hypothetical protein
MFLRKLIGKTGMLDQAMHRTGADLCEWGKAVTAVTNYRTQPRGQSVLGAITRTLVTVNNRNFAAV